MCSPRSDREVWRPLPAGHHRFSGESIRRYESTPLCFFPRPCHRSARAWRGICNSVRRRHDSWRKNADRTHRPHDESHHVARTRRGVQRLHHRAIRSKRRSGFSQEGRTRDTSRNGRRKNSGHSWHPRRTVPLSPLNQRRPSRFVPISGSSHPLRVSINSNAE